MYKTSDPTIVKNGSQRNPTKSQNVPERYKITAFWISFWNAISRVKYDEGCPKQIVARISLIKKEYFDTKDPVKITFAVSMNS